LNQHDDQLVKDFGVKLAVDMVGRLVREAHVPGVHLCTLNLEKSVQLVLEGLNWVHGPPEIHNKLIAVSPSNLRCAEFCLIHPQDTANDVTHVPPSDSEHVITASGAAQSITSGLVPVVAVSSDAYSADAGSGEVNSAATWDEFPNGRFGDFKSPAYGEQNQWGGSSLSVRLPRDTIDPCLLIRGQANEALSQWGSPRSTDDLTSLFLRYLEGTLDSTPFSSGPLSAESRAILPQLSQLTRRGLWTVGSQPAVDGAPSTDAAVGWGPAGGWVFQKAFVEFFAEEDEVIRIERAAAASGGWVHYFAANLQVNASSARHKDSADGLW
jgi:methylenetetrahydrofolate reductase (NADPH)